MLQQQRATARHFLSGSDTHILHVLSRHVTCCRHIATDVGEVSHDIRGGELSHPFHKTAVVRCEVLERTEMLSVTHNLRGVAQELH